VRNEGFDHPPLPMVDDRAECQRLNMYPMRVDSSSYLKNKCAVYRGQNVPGEQEHRRRRDVRGAERLLESGTA
jgi:hypothetical protein